MYSSSCGHFIKDIFTKEQEKFLKRNVHNFKYNDCSTNYPLDVLPDGTVIPHSRLTKPAEPARSYAYCCDTAVNSDMTAQLKDVNLLYHDSTYMTADMDRAEKYLHSTAAQAALTARYANAKKLILGHFSAKYSDESGFLREAAEIFPETLLAHEGMSVAVK